ncbi:leader peptidase (prepilin peptidase) / N-methyltransferase [Loktanella atrilutea]|uniref:Leader peptidase (Prepilin peptidase) / N-methyltransferase n=1 Tax=Loktanella atrilutea TaxID=366533 RepID=A0A1M4VDF0_LOKAT|nr:A24 family peptidase [Loktanella atrilutea]SHE67001.1 leader peptidase (prepilin peptidase) / N-methyltransferase [Loktanella atrilutea]
MFEILATAGLGVTLLVLSVIDIRTFRLPDDLTLPLILSGWLVNLVRSGAWPWDMFVAAAAGYLVFALIGWIHFRLRHMEGLGLGDAKLLAAAGAWVGLHALPVVVLLAALGGLGHAVMAGPTSGQRIPFGPWLAASFFGVWLLTIQ